MSGGERPKTFSEDSTQLITVPSSGNGVFNVRSVPDGALVRTIEHDPEGDVLLLPGGSLLTADFNAEQTSATLGLRTLEEDEGRRLGRWRPGEFVDCHFDPFGRWVVWAAGGQLLLQRYDDLDGRPRVIGRHEGDVVVTTGPWRDRVATSNAAGEVRLWDTESGGLVRAFQSPASARWVTLDPRGRFLATAPLPPDAPPGSFVLFDLQAPRGAEPVPLIGTEADGSLMNLEFDPKGRWLASTHNARLALWNLASRRAFTLRGMGQMASAAVAFTPDGRLLSTSHQGVVRLWALFHEEGDEVRVLYSRTQKLTEKIVGGFVAVDGQGRAIVGTQFGLFHALPLDGGAASTYQMEASDGRQIVGGLLQVSIPPGGGWPSSRACSGGRRRRLSGSWTFRPGRTTTFGPSPLRERAVPICSRRSDQVTRRCGCPTDASSPTERQGSASGIWRRERVAFSMRVGRGTSSSRSSWPRRTP